MRFQYSILLTRITLKLHFDFNIVNEQVKYKIILLNHFLYVMCSFQGLLLFEAAEKHMVNVKFGIFEALNIQLFSAVFRHKGLTRWPRMKKKIKKSYGGHTKLHHFVTLMTSDDLFLSEIPSQFYIL